MQGRTSNNSNEARVDIRTRGFRERGQQAFFDLRVFDPNAYCYRTKSLQQGHVMNQQEKKRAYNERILLEIHLFCFQLTVVWEERAKNCTRVWHN